MTSDRWLYRISGRTLGCIMGLMVMVHGRGPNSPMGSYMTYLHSLKNWLLASKMWHATNQKNREKAPVIEKTNK